MSSFASRVIGAARLDPRTYEEVEADLGSTGQAMGVVLLSSLAGGVGSLGFAVPSVGVIAAGGVAALLAWVALAVFTYVVGTQILAEPDTRADVAQLLRTLGFAQAPGFVRVLGAVPLIGQVALPLVAVWMLAATFMAVRQALDYKSTLRAIVVCVAGWLLSLGVYLFILTQAESWLRQTFPQQALLVLW